MTDDARSVRGQVIFAVTAAALFVGVFLVEGPPVESALASTAVVLGVAALGKRRSTRIADITIGLFPDEVEPAGADGRPNEE